jgi:hypothetical protein
MVQEHNRANERLSTTSDPVADKMVRSAPTIRKTKISQRIPTTKNIYIDTTRLDNPTEEIILDHSVDTAKNSSMHGIHQQPCHGTLHLHEPLWHPEIQADSEKTTYNHKNTKKLHVVAPHT